MEAYEECLGATSTKESAWYIVPVDDKKNSRLNISTIILDTLNKMKLSYSETDSKRCEELQVIRRELVE
jgi:hypothetical protein